MARALAIVDDRTDDGDRLDAVAVKALVRLFGFWKARIADASRLAGVGARTFSRMRAQNWDGVLSEDQRLRASALVGLYKGLHLYFGEELADKWVKMPNDGPLFGGRTPLAYMLEGGLPAILEVRDYVDALRGGA
ncbi:MbcA/ParS/Xre antitoxin family protein [Parasphingopyxis sp.]|uniref:MbcA/ParS/Xre antitoxin family protein n=1 Tax=Parasphingopyxis sp. TaxID=1920299 RepID=UPI003F9FB3F3